ncbi:MAG: LacI family DNA-binding transcriptional regulator [Acidimicrobiia bacterium]
MTKQRTPISRDGTESHSLRDVAKLAGVSVATASRVMSGSTHPVSEQTRQKVLEAADELSFQPNRLARALVTARSHTIGVIVHDISDPYFGEIVKGLEDGIHTEDYRLFVASSERSPDKELNYVRAFLAHQVDAMVFAASSLTEPGYSEALGNMMERFRAGGGVTVVLSDHVLPGPRVLFDNRRAVGEMVRYLAERGHRRIGYLTGPADLEVSRVRLGGFTSASEALGLEVGPENVADGHFTTMGGSEAVARLLEKLDFTAVLAANDLMAIGAIRRLLDSGWRVPDDISVVGLDDIPIAEYGPVPLTTMSVPTYQIGLDGASLLLEALAGNDPDDIHVTGEIIERSSVATLVGER